MSQTLDCQPACCDTLQTVNIPGNIGTTGAAGQGAFTTTTASFILPAAGATVALNGTGAADPFIHLLKTSWMAFGSTIYISDGAFKATFTVGIITADTKITALFLGNNGDSIAGSVMGINALVVPSGTQKAFSGLPTALTDTATVATTGNVVAAGAGVQHLEFPHTFIGGTVAVEPVTNYVIGYKFKILSWTFVTEVLLVGGGGSRVCNMEIGKSGVDVDVGTAPSTLTIPIANAVVGTFTNGAAVVGANTGTSADTFSIEIAAGGTAFTSGSGTFIITIQNMDTADAIKSHSDKINSLITALSP